MLREFNDKLLRLRVIHDEREIKLGFLITGVIALLLLGNVIYLNILILNNNSAASTTINSSKRTDKLTQELGIPTPTANQENNVTTQIGKATHEFSKRDYYINLGYGTNQSTEWADVTGTIGTYDISSYQNISEVRLESSISVPTANGSVSVRLYNKTDGYAVWNSERTVVAGVDMPLLISEKINYDQGPKMYVVQMKSQLGVVANLIQARLHIVTE